MFPRIQQVRQMDEESKFSLANNKYILLQLFILILFSNFHFDFFISIWGKEKVCHVNMFIKFYHPDQTDDKTPTIITVHQQDSSKTNGRRRHPVANSVICEKDNEYSSIYIIEPVRSSTASYKNVKINQSLPVKDKKLLKLLKKFSPIFSDIPGKSKTVKLHLKLTSNTHIKIWPYPVPIELRDKVETEIKQQESQKERKHHWFLVQI